MNELVNDVLDDRRAIEVEVGRYDRSQAAKTRRKKIRKNKLREDVGSQKDREKRVGVAVTRPCAVLCDMGYGEWGVAGKIFFARERAR
jgi:hypothetical protein